MARVRQGNEAISGKAAKDPRNSLGCQAKIVRDFHAVHRQDDLGRLGGLATGPVAHFQEEGGEPLFLVAPPHGQEPALRGGDLVTGLIQPGDCEQGLRQGALGLLVKPFDDVELLKLVEQGLAA